MVQDAEVKRGREQIEAVYRAEAPRLWRALVLHTGNREAANDAVSEAFVQLIGRGEQIRDPRAWVWKAAFSIAQGSKRPERSTTEIEPAVEDALPDDLIDLTRALAKLSHHQRAAAVLHYYGGYPVAEIATMLGSSRSAVGVHLFRARERLRREMGDRDD
jgi:RNA polymerase sigma factor (sigma-70 family)